MSDFELNFQERESEVDFITLDVKERLREIISNRRKMHNIVEVGKRVCPNNKEFAVDVYLGAITAICDFPRVEEAQMKPLRSYIKSTILRDYIFPELKCGRCDIQSNNNAF